MQEDRMRHDRCADDADRKVDRLRPTEARDQAAERIRGRGTDLQGLVQEAGEHDPEQRKDGQLEAPVPAAL